MKYASFLYCFAVAGGALACASTGGAERQETTPHSHAGHSHQEHPHSAAEETPSAAPDVAATDTAPSEGQKPAEQELAAYETARPVFEARCAKCHAKQGSKSSSKALMHFSMDDYPFGGHHAGEITATIRKVLGATGTTPTMPRDKPGAVKGEELRVILAWADAYDRAHANAAAPKQHDHDHDHGGSTHEH